jgi:hypothetical protein
VRQRRQDQLQAYLASEQLDLQTRMEVLSDAFGAMERTLDELLGHLCASGQLDAGAEFIGRWKEAVAQLRRQGLKRGSLPGDPKTEKVTCPGCNAVLANVDGPGGRCDWCGHVFSFCCPACGQELQNVSGQPGETCLWCQHQF